MPILYIQHVYADEVKVSEQQDGTLQVSSSKEGKKSTKGNKNSKNTSKNKKSSKVQRNYRPSKDKKASAASSRDKIQQAEAEAAKSKPFDTWESPRGVSELGHPIAEGFVQPYPYGNLMRQFAGGKCRHRGHDIGVVGEVQGGLGTPVNAAVRAEITLIGDHLKDSANFGRPDKRTGFVNRTGKKYPRRIIVNGYGLVYPFSRTYGKWRSGNVVVTKILSGELAGYTLRYMHLAAVRPDLKVGDILEAGEHLGVMGGTAVQDSHPHVHLDLVDLNGARVDLAPYIGIHAEPQKCSKPKTKSKKAKKKSKKNKKSKRNK